MTSLGQANPIPWALDEGGCLSPCRVISGANLQAAAERMWAGVSKGDWAGREIDELSPQSFPAFRA
jgi:hypothetical protein